LSGVSGDEEVATPFPVHRYRERVLEELPITDLLMEDEGDPFRIRQRCQFAGIGIVTIEPLSTDHFALFQRFYDGRHPGWGLSEQSRRYFNEHPEDTETLAKMARRVRLRQDARFVVMAEERIVGYLLLEEIDSIKAGRSTCHGEDYHAMLGIGISDRYHGTGLASLGMFFLKLVAALAEVGMGLSVSSQNLRARRFYEKNGFAFAGHKKIIDTRTGEERSDAWYVLERNELGIREEGQPRQ
jgi:ribosomal protein S18 acetylase RimI-like enzyme